MLMKTIAATVLALALAGATAADAQTPMPAKVADTAKGKALVNAQGMTLYVFDRDTAGKSTCNGPCAQNWPPRTLFHFATGGSGRCSSVCRLDRRDAR